MQNAAIEIKLAIAVLALQERPALSEGKALVSYLTAPEPPFGLCQRSEHLRLIRIIIAKGMPDDDFHFPGIGSLCIKAV